jgi:hypothetical protein
MACPMLMVLPAALRVVEHRVSFLHFTLLTASTVMHRLFLCAVYYSLRASLTNFALYIAILCVHIVLTLNTSVQLLYIYIYIYIR